MRKSRILTITLVFFLLALIFSSTTKTLTVRAEDPCTECMRFVQAHYEACEAALGPNQICYDQYNNDVVLCYATVCEQR
jgi:hypothetical protein